MPLNADELKLDFDVTGDVLGAATHFVGFLSTSTRGFDLFASGTVTLALPNGQKLVDLTGTIDLGRDSDFFIALAGDFSLPGTDPAEVRLEGGLGSSGVSLYARVDNWGLVPGLTFDGLVRVRFGSGTGALLEARSLSDENGRDVALARLDPIDQGPINPGTNPGRPDPIDSIKPDPIDLVPPVPIIDPIKGSLIIPIDSIPQPTDGIVVEIDVSTMLVGTRLRLTGKLIGDSGGSFDLDLKGSIHFGGPLVGMVSLDVNATVVTQSPRFGPKTYGLEFDGNLLLFDGANRVHVSASLNGDSRGNWTITVRGGVSFNFSATVDDVIKFTLSVDINGTLKFGSRPSDLAFALKVKGTARASVPKFDLSGSLSLDVGIQLDLSEGKLTIPDARPKLHYPFEGSPPTSIEWKDFRRDLPDKTPPANTVKVSHGPNTPIEIGGRAPTSLVIRGTDASERVQVTRSVLSPLPGVVIDTLNVRASSGNSDWVELFSVKTADVASIDIDMSGGNDSVEVLGTELRSGFTIPTLIRGGSGSDTLMGGAGPNTIYGNREDNAEAALDGDDVLVGGGSHYNLYGQGGNDILRGNGGSDTLEGGVGVNVVNGTLQLQGSAGSDHIQVNSVTSRFGGFGRLPSLRAGLVVQIISPDSAPVTVSKLPMDEIQRIQVDAGAGNDDIVISSRVALPSVLNGGRGADKIQAGSSSTTINGGEGNDELHGGTANDAIYGEAGDDTLFGGGGDNTLNGGPGNNTIHPGAGANAIEATAVGNVLMQAIAAGEAFYCAPGHVYAYDEDAELIEFSPLTQMIPNARNMERVLAEFDDAPDA
jgi:Ca2+-binding RTX toxin-like protein